MHLSVLNQFVVQDKMQLNGNMKIKYDMRSFEWVYNSKTDRNPSQIVLGFFVNFLSLVKSTRLILFFYLNQNQYFLKIN